MGLGLDQLTDDQLLELLQESCIELARRDPYVRDLAQHTITTEAEKLAAKKQLLREAITAEGKKYIDGLRKEIHRQVSEGVANGSIRLLSPEQEAAVVVDATLEAKIKIIDETAQAIQQGKVGAAASDRFKPPPGFDASVGLGGWDDDLQMQELALTQEKTFAALAEIQRQQQFLAMGPQPASPPPRVKRKSP